MSHASGGLEFMKLLSPLHQLLTRFGMIAGSTFALLSSLRLQANVAAATFNPTRLPFLCALKTPGACLREERMAPGVAAICTATRILRTSSTTARQ